MKKGNCKTNMWSLRSIVPCRRYCPTQLVWQVYLWFYLLAYLKPSKWYLQLLILRLVCSVLGDQNRIYGSLGIKWRSSRFYSTFILLRETLVESKCKREALQWIPEVRVVLVDSRRRDSKSYSGFQRHSLCSWTQGSGFKHKGVMQVDSATEA